jgi:hypothetical protein
MFLKKREKLLLTTTWIMKVTSTPDAMPVISPTLRVIKRVTKKMINCSLPIRKIFFILSGEANL